MSRKKEPAVKVYEVHLESEETADNTTTLWGLAQYQAVVSAVFPRALKIVQTDMKADKTAKSALDFDLRDVVVGIGEHRPSLYDLRDKNDGDKAGSYIRSLRP